VLIHRGSKEPRVLPVVTKGSAGPPVLSKKNKLRLTFAATRRIF